MNKVHFRHLLYSVLFKAKKLPQMVRAMYSVGFTSGFTNFNANFLDLKNVSCPGRARREPSKDAFGERRTPNNLEVDPEDKLRSCDYEQIFLLDGIYPKVRILPIL